MKLVVAFGVFDGLHPGHISFLLQAKRLGDELVVVITRDAVAAREKGKTPRLSARERQQIVAAVRWVDTAVIGDTQQRYGTVLRRLRPDIIALGYDQPCTRPAFRARLATLGLPHTRIVRCRKHADGHHHNVRYNN